MEIHSTDEFNEWMDGLDPYTQGLVGDRLDRIRQHHHFGDRKYLGGHLFELRWPNGRRIYYSIVKGEACSFVLMLLGGDKNGQKRDIARARQILGREAS